SSCPCGAPPGDEKQAAAGIVVVNGTRIERSARVWCCEPADQSDPGVRGGTTECGSRLGSTHSRICERWTPCAARSATAGGPDGGHVSALLWARHPQAGGGGMLDHARGGRSCTAGDPD